MMNKNILKITVIYLFLFLILNPHNAFSSESINIDKQLKEADSIRSSDSTKFSNILSKIKKHNDILSSDQQHYLNYLLAYQHSFSGQFEKSIAIYKKIINSNANIELKFRANSSIVNIYAIAQNWTEGLAHLSQNFEMLKQINDKEIQQNGLIISVIFYNLIDQYDLGLQYAQKVQSETKNVRTLCFANHLLLEAKFKLKQITEGNKEIDLGILSCEKANETIVINLIHSYLANLQIDNGTPKKAISLLLNSLNDVENTNYAPLIAKYYSLLAKAYFLENKLIESTSYAYKTLSKTDGSGNTLPFILAHSLLYKIELQNNNQQKALEHYIKFSEADKAYLKDEKNKHLAFQLAAHKELEQKNEIAFLNKQNDLLKAEQALTNANIENTRFVLIMLSATLSIILLWGYRLLKAHKRIKQLAEFDPLTGIFNRGHFTQVAKTTLEYCERTDQELSVVMFDLDYFKNVNDNYGHACGDWALKKVIEVCKTFGRQNDIFARLGGEEFCILLTCCDKQSALHRAEACRKAIAEINTEESGFNFSITASFGITDTKTSSYVLDKLLADADSATYSSKHIGRNQVTLFQPEINTTLEMQKDEVIFSG
jgi:diguanylate cyclase (GGDEF)-like protein